jgi:hypothetical protein
LNPIEILSGIWIKFRVQVKFLPRVHVDFGWKREGKRGKERERRRGEREEGGRREREKREGRGIIILKLLLFLPTGIRRLTLQTVLHLATSPPLDLDASPPPNPHEDLFSIGGLFSNLFMHCQVSTRA